MRISMTREEAVEILVHDWLASMTSDERAPVLLDWWSIDSDDTEYNSLSPELKEALTSLDEPDDPGSPVYEPLLLIGLRRTFIGVLNSYLEARLMRVGVAANVAGTVEVLAACCCCGSKCLSRRGGFEVCPVCFWEDDGTTDPGVFSGPNHMTLGDARLNYERAGAVSVGAKQFVLSDGALRYAR
jgi:hypothetical protein